MRSKVSLFLQAWLGDFKRSDVERKKLGEIAKNVRDKQNLAHTPKLLKELKRKA